MSKEVIIQEGQSLFDLTLQEHGTLEGLFSVMEDNNLDSVNQDLGQGARLEIKAEPIEKQIVQYYQDLKVSVNSWFKTTAVRSYNSDFNLDFN